MAGEIIGLNEIFVILIARKRLSHNQREASHQCGFVHVLRGVRLGRSVCYIRLRRPSAGIHTPVHLEIIGPIR